MTSQSSKAGSSKNVVPCKKQGASSLDESDTLLQEEVDRNPADADNECPENLYLSQQNPLLIPLVIDELMKNLDFETLKSARVVCQEWNKVCIPLLSPKCIMEFPVTEEILPYRYFETVKTRFNLVPPILLQSLAIHSRILHWYDILERIGTQMISLKLYINELNLFQLQSILLFQCPNLQELWIEENIDSEYSDIPKDLPKSSIRRFANSLKRHRLQLTQLKLYLRTMTSDALAAVSIAIAKASNKSLYGIAAEIDEIRYVDRIDLTVASLSQLKKLSLFREECIPPPLKLTLSHLHLQLEDYPTDDSRLEANLITLYSCETVNKLYEHFMVPTLESVHFTWKDTPQVLTFLTSMDNLEVFRVESPEIQLYFRPSFSFLAKMPKLKELVVKACPNLDEFFHNECKFYSSWLDCAIESSLTNDYMRLRPNLRILKFLGELNLIASFNFLDFFPNVQEFHVILGSYGIRNDQGIDIDSNEPINPWQWNLLAVQAILTKLKNLRELVIVFTVSSCISVLQEDFTRIFSENLSSMRYLKKLKIYSGLEEGTDETILNSNIANAIAEAPALKFVKFHGYSVLAENHEDFIKPYKEKNIRVDLAEGDFYTKFLKMEKCYP